MERWICTKCGCLHNSGQLEAALDKLVAVRMDLEPASGTSTVRAQAVVSRELIAGACEILHSAITDIRNVVYQINPTIARGEAGII